MPGRFDAGAQTSLTWVLRTHSHPWEITVKRIVLLVVAISLVTPFTVRSSPKPAPNGQPTIYRDEYGIPHIFAPTLEGAGFAIGYAQAEDRLLSRMPDRKDKAGADGLLNIEAIADSYWHLHRQHRSASV